MVYLIMILNGIAFFVRGEFLFIQKKKKSIRLGVVSMIIGALLVMFAVFFYLTSIAKADELPRENVRYAGIVLEVNNMTKDALEQEVETEEVEPIVVGNSVEQSDIDLLARLMTAEQGYGADERDYYLTGSVVINRIDSEKFPNTLEEVIYQTNPPQYQCVSNGHIYREYDEVAYQVAEELLVYGTDIPKNVVYQAEFTQGSGIYDKRNRTYYCYQ